ncbi:helix-turn-helix transcriptional regulator [Burkholderia multivorans]|uniref:helix-turn-helix transcriptional regulator n=1 Tax=Burkholderia multivorans TaxID=87883 RepID=UPI002ECFADDB|nr:LuxR C-terminal-related transcriptional regulator [Burkholderia multivorans]
MNISMDKVASMISAIGTDHFGAALLDIVDGDFGLSHCTVFEQVGDNPPACLLAEGIGSGASHYARELAQTYVAEAYAADPILLTLRQAAKPTPSVNCFDPYAFDQHSDARTRAFIRQYYIEPQLSQEAICSVRNGNRLLWISLYKQAGSAAFSDSDRSGLSDLLQVMLAGAQRQSAIRNALADSGTEAQATPPHPSWSDATRAETLVRVRSALLMDPCGLTQREAEILAHIVVGYQALAISLRLGISINTVATHRKRAYAKLHLSSQTELFHVCLKQGLLHH